MKKFFYIIVACFVIMSCGRLSKETGNLELLDDSDSNFDAQLGDELQLMWMKSMLDTMEMSDNHSNEHQCAVLQLKSQILFMEGSYIEGFDVMSQAFEAIGDLRSMQALRARRAWVTGNHKLATEISDSVIDRCKHEIDSLSNAPQTSENISRIGNIIIDMIGEYAMTDRENEAKVVYEAHQLELEETLGIAAQDSDLFSTLVLQGRAMWQSIEKKIQEQTKQPQND